MCPMAISHTDHHQMQFLSHPHFFFCKPYTRVRNVATPTLAHILPKLHPLTQLIQLISSFIISFSPSLLIYITPNFHSPYFHFLKCKFSLTHNTTHSSSPTPWSKPMCPMAISHTDRHPLYVLIDLSRSLGPSPFFSSGVIGHNYITSATTTSP